MTMIRISIRDDDDSQLEHIGAKSEFDGHPIKNLAIVLKSNFQINRIFLEK